MAPGEDAARAGLGASVRENRAQVAMTEESRVLLVALLRDEMKDAVRDGITAAMSDENAERFCAVVLKQLSSSAEKKAGAFVLGGVKRLIGVGVILTAVWMLGGGAAVKVVWALMDQR